MRLAVVSDLHANARAVERAIVMARAASPDRLVVLGDLLTYGLDVKHVLDLVSEAVDRDGAVVVLGNHDQLYLDLAEGKTAYFEVLPEWIRECAEHTLRELDVASFRSRFAWRTEERAGPVYLAHANPFGYGDWTYLNANVDIVRAGRALIDKGATIGVFGHNHRGAVAAVSGDSVTLLATTGEARTKLSADHVYVTNAGSVGQPRSRERTSTMLILDVDRDALHASIDVVDYDVAAQVADVRGSSLSAATREKLASFF